MGLHGGSSDKESACNVGNLGSIPGLGRSPGGRLGNPLQYSCLENPYGQRGLGCSPWGHKDLATTEQLSTAHTALRVIVRKPLSTSQYLGGQSVLPQ